MTTSEHQIADLILELERELRMLGLWGACAPSHDALRSTQPFSVDTLDFTQWLQWVFIPRMADMLERGEPLPRDCAIAPLAEAVLEDMKVDTTRLLKLIRRVDRSLSR